MWDDRVEKSLHLVRKFWSYCSLKSSIQLNIRGTLRLNNNQKVTSLLMYCERYLNYVKLEIVLFFWKKTSIFSLSFQIDCHGQTWRSRKTSYVLKQKTAVSAASISYGSKNERSCFGQWGFFLCCCYFLKIPEERMEMLQIASATRSLKY